MEEYKRAYKDPAKMAALKVEAAKAGFADRLVIGEFNASKATVNFKDMIAEGNRLSNKLRERALALINENKEKEAEDLLQVCATLGSLMNHYDECHQAQKEIREVNGQMAANGGMSPNLQGGYEHATGATASKAPKILAKGEAFPRNGTDPGFQLGDLMRAMAVGGGSREVRNALSEGVSSNGGVTVPQYLMAGIVDAMRARAVVSQAGARVMSLDTDMTTLAKVEKNPTAAWRLENSLVQESSPTFAGVTFQPKSLACIVKCSNELLADSQGLEDALSRAFGASLGTEVDRVALFGSGQGAEPAGLIHEPQIATVEMPGDGAALTDWSSIIDLLYLMRSQNSWGENTAMVASPLVWKQICSFKSKEDQPLRRPIDLEGIPLLTSTVVPENMTHGNSTNATCLFAGNFSSLVLGFRQNLQIQVLRETYADHLQTAFLASLRMDIGIIHPEELGVLKGIVPADSAVKSTRK